MTALVPVLVMLIGGVAYLLPCGKASELGRIAFAAGVFALCFAFAGKVVGIL